MPPSQARTTERAARPSAPNHTQTVILSLSCLLVGLSCAQLPASVTGAHSSRAPLAGALVSGTVAAAGATGSRSAPSTWIVRPLDDSASTASNAPSSPKLPAVGTSPSPPRVLDNAALLEAARFQPVPVGLQATAMTTEALVALLAPNPRRAPLGSVISAPVRIDMVNQLGEEATFFIPLDGFLDEAAQSEIETFFRCRRTGRRHRIDTPILAKLADLGRHYRGHVIELVSAYRHPPHAARTSRHRHGRAIDVRVEGVTAREVRDYLWSRYDDEVGVGYYRNQQFVHLDHRPGHELTAWTQSTRNGRNHYQPRWARAKLDALKQQAREEAVEPESAAEETEPSPRRHRADKRRNRRQRDGAEPVRPSEMAIL